MHICPLPEHARYRIRRLFSSPPGLPMNADGDGSIGFRSMLMFGSGSGMIRDLRRNPCAMAPVASSDHHSRMAALRSTQQTQHVSGVSSSSLTAAGDGWRGAERPPGTEVFRSATRCSSASRGGAIDEAGGPTAPGAVSEPAASSLSNEGISSLRRKVWGRYG